jgi:histidyl-tRNA synthetase
MAVKIQKPRGTADIMPDEAKYWQYIEAKARAVAKKYGFGEIRTPTFEDISLFKRGVGDSTDIVQKEMYVFEDRENRQFALRPEGTASVARALIEGGHCSDTMPIKLYYLMNCFRYEKPQAGRSREFMQFGTEIYGSSSPSADFTSIALGDAFIRELGITNVTLHINSIGCPTCRPGYRQKLVEYFSAHTENLCGTCNERLEKNPLRILDCKSEVCKNIAKDAPVATDNLCPECEKHFSDVKDYLTAGNIPYVVDTSIVRGLDYYTKTVFEFIAEGIGAQGTVCAGGRYDGLMEQLGGPALPGIGFASGLSRLILAMRESGVTLDDDNKPKLYIAPMGEAAMKKALVITEKLRNGGTYAECDTVGRSLKAQMKYADKIGAEYTLIVGDSEIESGKAQLKHMTDSTQTEVDIDNFTL